MAVALDVCVTQEVITRRNPVESGFRSGCLAARRANGERTWHRRLVRGVGWAVVCVLLFRPAVAVGAATLLDFVTSTGGGIGLLLNSVSVTVSPDGRHVYVASYDEHAVAVFAIGFASCSPTPVVDCRTAVKGSLSLVDRSPDKRDAFAWSWGKGETTTAAEFDPSTTNHYAVCVYDESQVPAPLVLSALVPAGGNCGTPSRSRPCWNAVTGGERTQFRYGDRWATPEGMKRMTLSESTSRQSPFIRVKGKGEDVVMPALPLRVQMQGAAGGCWEGTYSTARVNTSTQFRATSD